jgi:CO/xanthine dehydrogenase Mo-binding subunit
VQCGFCIPGFAMRAHALLDKDPHPTREEIAKAIRPHLCRCTGYKKIVDAVEILGEKRRRGEEPRSHEATEPRSGEQVDQSRDREGADGKPRSGEQGAGSGEQGAGSGEQEENSGAMPTALGGHAHRAQDMPTQSRRHGTHDQSGRVGTRLDRYRGREFVLGDHRYVDDIKVAGSLYAAMCFSEHPRALLKGIDAAAALAMDGVHRVITAADVPGERYIGLIKQDWPVLVALGEETRCIGDIVAIVVADDQRRAREAAAKVAIDYEVRAPLTTPEAALMPDAPKIHPDGNLLSTSKINRADPDAAFANSAHVVEDDFSTQRIEHMFLEPEACIAILEGAEGPRDQGSREGAGRWAQGAEACESAMPTALGGHAEQVPDMPTQSPRHGTHAERRTLDHKPKPRGAGGPPVVLRILSQGQGVFDDQRQIAKILGWEPGRVLVELVSNGGAFGGKEDMSIQGQTALAAALTGRPVKCTLTREESFRLHPKRHAIKMHVKVGCDADGHITAVRARMIGDKGAYASVGAKVLERAAGHAVGPYKVPAIDVESLAVYTNNPPCGAMRGFGANQSAFAIESLLNRLAKKVGIDEWEIRWRNILDQGDQFCTGQILDKPFGLRKTLLAVKDAYKNAKYAGIACGIKNTGIGNGMPDIGKVVMKVEAPDRITIRTGFTEMGQGYFTILIQSACEETGLPPEVFVPMTDTSVDTNCGQTTASRATVLGGLAVIDACKKLRADLAACHCSASSAEGASCDSDQSRDREGAGGKPRSHEATEPRSGEQGAGSREQEENSGAMPTALGGHAHRAADMPTQGRQHGTQQAGAPDLCTLIGREYVGHYACTYTSKLGADVENPKTHLTYGYATQVVILDDDGAIAKVIAAHDVGRVMNPTLLEGQMEGSIHMGLGYALTEDFPCEGGQLVNKTIKSLDVLRAHQMPEIECIFIEEPDPETAYGARGVGEIGLVPTAPAVAGALEKFDGVQRTSLPMRDSPAARAILKPRRR